MPHQPKQIFQNLPEHLQEEIREEIVNLFQQIIYEFITKNSTPPSNQKGDYLCPPIKSESGLNESGKSASSICPKAKSPRNGLDGREY